MVIETFNHIVWTRELVSSTSLRIKITDWIVNTSRAYVRLEASEKEKVGESTQCWIELLNV